MIKAIIFDNIGVFTAKGRTRRTVNLFASRFGINAERLELEYRRLMGLANNGDMTSAQIFQSIIDTFDVNATVDDLRRAHLDAYGEDRDPQMYEYAAELSKQYPIYMFTNFSDAFLDLDEKHQLYSVFKPESIFVSYKIKLKKPDPKAFKYVLNKIGFQPDEVAFIDDRQENIDGAVALGIRGILYQDIQQLKVDVVELLAKENGGIK